MEKYRLRNFFIHFLVSGPPCGSHRNPGLSQILDRNFAKKSEKARKHVDCGPFRFCDEISQLSTRTIEKPAAFIYLASPKVFMKVNKNKQP